MDNMPVTPEQPVPPPTVEADDKVVFKRSHFYSIMVVFAFSVGVLVGYIAWGQGPDPQQASVAPPAQAQAPAQAPAQAAAEPSFTRYDIPTEGYPSLGPEDAEIVLVEFSDYQ